jgi:hypothetical protein
MTTVQITFDAKETGSFDAQHDAFIRELRNRGLVVSKATGRERAERGREGSEITIQLFHAGIALADTVADIRHAASRCLRDTLPGLTRHLIAYGPQGQRLVEVNIPPEEPSAVSSPSSSSANSTPPLHVGKMPAGAKMRLPEKKAAAPAKAKAKTKAKPRPPQPRTAREPRREQQERLDAGAGLGSAMPSNNDVMRAASG